MTGAELLVGGWFASPVIRRVVEKAHKYLGANYELRKDTHGLIEALTRTLLLCQATIEEAEKLLINNSNLANWLKKLKEVVYDADDVLDNMEAKSIKDKIQAMNKVSQFASSSLSGLKNMFLPDYNHKNLRKVLYKLREISADIPNFVNLVNMNENDRSNIHELSEHRESISQPLEEVRLYGRDEELNVILEMILDSDSESSKKNGQIYNKYHGLLVLPIVGIGGVGKTSLAKAIYNDPEVQQTFASKAWISVAYNLDVIMLMRKLNQSLGGYVHLDVITLEDISKNLSKIIRGMRFFVVLDDLFEKIEYQWDVIFTILSHGAPGSVVLITTQNQSFAKRVATFGHIALNLLELAIFWKLFKQFAFGNVVIPEEKRKSLKLIGKQIACKLRGLPLAAKIIGRLLRRNIDEDYWRRISGSEWWDIDEGKGQILPSIGVGYQHLNPFLRQCFAYCSLFPRNSLIEKDRLVQMWIAQNFVPHDTNSARPEDVGANWFDKLVEMSFFQPTGDHKGYVMPNLMHDLAVIVSSDECFYLSDNSQEIPLSVRHLAVDTKNLEVIKRIQNYNKLRSFLYFGFSHVNEMCSTINSTLCKLDRIRVLDLSYLHMETKEPPKAIENLNHLRFLDLSSTGIEVLSYSSFDHYHLQALYIQKCQLRELPRGFCRLINLRHLNVDTETISLISGIGKLTNLQKLNRYPVGEQEGHRISELKNLREIRGHLMIEICDNIKSQEEAVQANLADKNHLDSIEICWFSLRRRSNIDLKILEGLKPNEHIKELKIVRYMGSSLPHWMMKINQFVNLHRIHLYACVSLEILSPLGQLPTLKHLSLKDLNSVKVIDHNFYGNSQIVFPGLREFIFQSHSCEEWIETRVGEFFPSLTFLEILWGPIRRAPLHCFGASLKVLKIEGCEHFNSLERSLRYLSCLATLNILGSRMSISLNLNYLMLLEELHLRNCPELRIEGNLQSLTNLKRLEITSCPNILDMSKQKGKGLEVHQGEEFQSLVALDMDFLNEGYHQIVGKLPSLQILKYRYWKHSHITTYQILWFQELTNLRELNFFDCKFEHLPSSLAKLLLLKILRLVSCTKLESLPANVMPPFLWELHLGNCSENLVQRCQPNKGEDWHLISHIPLIGIDGRVVYHRPQSSEGAAGDPNDSEKSVDDYYSVDEALDEGEDFFDVPEK
ncbi:hypothetical protein LUZ63_009251 [Rhynchospora breviuscula]|uniref:Uncharacterized protein n=1 Tax=Rhynchospora breviuscula TaxID=2022672 RepID=A0A9Q0CES2_9POAL|nr:hypothetical protein LUZ63_009251 [Rhynchospora breviuscula]